MNTDIQPNNGENSTVREQMFISYRWSDSGGDEPFERFVRSVESCTGLKAFWDKEYLRSGNFKATLPKKVTECYVFIPIVTDAYIKFGTLGGRDDDADYCLLEYATAIRRGKKIVPIFSGPGDNSRTVSENEAKAAAEKALSGEYDDQDRQILIKYLLSQNGVTLDISKDTLEEQLKNKRDCLSSIIFDTFCLNKDIPFYKDHLTKQAEKLNPVRVFGDFDSKGLTLENSYVPLSFLRQLNETERKEKENRRESTAPDDADEKALTANLNSERFSVIVGDAGQGKSTFVRRLCIDLAQKAQDHGVSRELFYPLYFECKKIDSASFSNCDLFLNELAKDADLSRPALDKLLYRGKPLFIFDAVDEVSPSQAEQLIEAVHRHLVLEYGNTYFVFTSRPGQKLVAGGDMKLDNTEKTAVRRYDVKAFSKDQRDAYIEKLAAAKNTDGSVKDEFIRALDEKETGIADYKAVSRNPFMIFAVFVTYGKGRKLPETRFDAILRVMNDVIDRDLEKPEKPEDKYKFIRRDNIKTVLGKAAYQLYRQRDKGEIPYTDTNTLVSYAEKIYNLSDMSGSDGEKLAEYMKFFKTSDLFDENGFRHEFLASTYAAYYLYFMMKKRVKKDADPVGAEDEPLRQNTDYWQSVAESLLCLLDLESEDSKTYIEPLLLQLQKEKTPDYGTLCKAVSQFKNHQARSAVLLLKGMLVRGCVGIRTGIRIGGGFTTLTLFKKARPIKIFDPISFVCSYGVNPYEELFYYPAIYSALQAYLPDLPLCGENNEDGYIRDELIKEVCALFSDKADDELQRVYDCRKANGYEKATEKLENAAYRTGSSIRGYVHIKDSVTEIYRGAFSDCFSLTSITIPDSVTSIGERAFAGCSSLTNITIPDSVTLIGEDAFKGCTSIEKMIVSPKNGKYHSDGNCIIETESKTLIAGCKNSVIPTDGSVTSIGRGAFADCLSLTSITIPDSIKSIGGSAFNDCVRLTDITIPSSVDSIGELALTRCPNIETMTVGKDNKKYHSEGNCIIETESKTLIAGCKNSVIPADGSVTSIGESAFSGCTNLIDITIPNSVTSIGTSAFGGCKSLTSITIPDSVKSISAAAFAGCSSLTNITIPDGVTSIGWGVLGNCSRLTSITIPGSVTSIVWQAFIYCTGLRTVYYSGTEEQWAQIEIENGNVSLLNAEIVYNYKG